MNRLLYFIALIVAVFVANNVFAYVSPGKPAGYVNDYTGTLSQKTKIDIEKFLSSFSAAKKGEVAVAVVPTLNGDAIENYSIALAREWGIGVKGKDNGVLLLVVKNDRELRIEVGYGFEGVLTDAKSSRIIREVITPRFKVGQYDEGVSEGVRAIVGVIDPAFKGGSILPETTNNTGQSSDSSTSIAVIVIIYLAASSLSFVASVLGRSKSWWFGGVLGGLLGLVISYFFAMGVMVIVVLAVIGLFFDFIVSRGYQKSVDNGTRPPWWAGGSGGFGGGSGGGFGGFSGGSFGGGGSSGRW